MIHRITKSISSSSRPTIGVWRWSRFIGCLFAMVNMVVLPLAAQADTVPGTPLEHLQVLAADSMQGRLTGTEGAARARAYLLAHYDSLGVHPFGDTYTAPFSRTSTEAQEAGEGINLIGYVPGTAWPDRFIVLSAHYDHLGVRDGTIYNGADDNASGVAALLEIARYVRQHPLRHSLLLAAFDAEEQGLQGARAFVANPPIPRDSIVLNVNLDMLSRSTSDELFVAGTAHYPMLKAPLQQVQAQSAVHLRFGHDQPGEQQDWTYASDHGPFHEAGIPFVYFGVEDHPDYHQPTDDFDAVDRDFYLRVVDTVLQAIIELDRALPFLD